MSCAHNFGSGEVGFTSRLISTSPVPIGLEQKKTFHWLKLTFTSILTNALCFFSSNPDGSVEVEISLFSNVPLMERNSEDFDGEWTSENSSA